MKKIEDELELLFTERKQIITSLFTSINSQKTNTDYYITNDIQYLYKLQIEINKLKSIIDTEHPF